MDGNDADDPVGANMKLLILTATAVVAITSAGSAQAATTIGFQSLATANTMPITYVESGYTIQSNNTREPVPGSFVNSTLSPQKYVGANETGLPSVGFSRSTSFTLTGGTFTFDGLAAYFGASTAFANSFTVVGSLLNEQLYSMQFTATGGTIQSNNFFRAFESGSSTIFDKLVFTSGASGGSVYLDDIRVSAATIPTPDPVPTVLPPVTSAVPEPATWAMMILGFAVVGGAMRRRRHQVTVRYA